MITIYYQLHEHDDTKNIKYSEYVEFCDTVDKVLKSPDGWEKYGINFIKTNRDEPNVLNIRLANDNDTLDFCKFPNLSCYSVLSKEIYIRYSNWMGKSNSSLPLNEYREYVINHEVGHHLQTMIYGKNAEAHPPIDKNKVFKSGESRLANIMMQMSKGPDHVYPYIENSKVIGNTLREALGQPHVRGGYQNKKDIDIIYIIIILCILCILIYSLYKSICTNEVPIIPTHTAKIL